jgi:hypothetical protein
VSLKKLSVSAVAVLACVTGLTACSENHGAAAFVSDTRISDRSINKYLTKSGPDAANANRVSPRISTLSELIQEQVFTDALAKTPGGVPTDAQREAVREDARTLLVTDSQGAPYDDASLTQLADSFGLKPNFAELILNNAELEYLYIERSKVANPQELANSITKLNIPVTVNPSYGTWEASALGLNSSPTAGRPNFITFQTPAPATTAATS